MDSTSEGIADKKNCKDAGRLINILSNQLKRHFLLPDADSGLTHMQRNILHFILFASLHREIYQKDIEEEFQIRKSTATGILQLMEKNGFIKRESVARDARLKKLLPTAKSLALRNDILQNIQKVEQKMLHGIPEFELEMCMNTLQKMSENLMMDEQKLKQNNQGGRHEQKVI
ncbi:MarR family winged helix-turn-helix transcriptional regulator [Lachnoclostridium sp. An181]|uniref:MarR family winged helix-turn-helix transcriptional regulator n=1 Tax=Lachnoclostridium sp. An181 TaxID=1965575 RepID=UPI000B37A24E|nr:MarR family winged helix-turn-helix transcriptional regulator [Lachnoclostridium sp. An181]OUP48882.1 MarR family transcriptional regulator [Lachnoclostridium sp. An181]